MVETRPLAGMAPSATTIMVEAKPREARSLANSATLEK